VPAAPAYTICARAPLRVDLAGGGSDIAPFLSREQGAAVAVALSLFARVEVRLGGGTIRLRSEDRFEQVTLRSPAELVYDGRLDAAKAALNMLPVTGGIELLSRCDAPAGAGLGERGARNVAVLAALAHCRNEALAPEDLAELAFQLETAELKRWGGRQDPYMAALGGACALRFDQDAVGVRALARDPEPLAELGAHMLVVFPGRAYAAEGVTRRIWEALEAGDPAVTRALAALRDLAGPMAQELAAGAWRHVGDLLNVAAEYQGQLDPLWSAPPTRALVGAARAAGAWGVKPAGPRPGASLVALGPPERRGAIARAVASQGGMVLDCQPAFQGVEVWREPLPPS
jgi:D-glycero-alpha-D-manno-heptose-7-phosphate kinase